MLNFLKGVLGLVQTLIILVLFLGYTFVVAKTAAQTGVNAKGNPVKEKALSVMLGVEPPAGDGKLWV